MTQLDEHKLVEIQMRYERDFLIFFRKLIQIWSRSTKKRTRSTTQMTESPNSKSLAQVPFCD